MTKKNDDEKPVTQTVADRPVKLADRITDFSLPIANAEQAKKLNLNVETARAVGQAVADLLARLPATHVEPELNAAAYGAFDPEQHRPQNLPVPRANLPALTGYEHMLWRQIGQLPGYRFRPIRDLGNDVFMAFPCFRGFAEEAKARKFDAHSQVLTISDFTHDRATINHIAKLIAENGVLLDAAQLDYGNTVPGYRPRFALFMTETWTFKLVQDKIENGAPVDANFIYAWPGGARFYRPKLDAQVGGSELINERPNSLPLLSGYQAKIANQL